MPLRRSQTMEDRLNTRCTIITASLAAAFFASPAWSADDVQSVARSPSNSGRARDG